MNDIGQGHAAPLLRVFRRAVAEVPAYATLLREHGVRMEDVNDEAAFLRLCPVTNKASTFGRFALSELCGPGGLDDLAGVLTSSGHGGRFSFGLITRAHSDGGAAFIDRVLDEAFEVRSKRTLAINCLPMGVGFSSRVMTVATTSVREDMVLALVRSFGARYEQILLVGDPLFLKLLIDRARDEALDWKAHTVHVVIGEEIFGERYRSYLGRALGHDPAREDRGYIMSSFGVGELGLHLCFETPATIALRRCVSTTTNLVREFLGTGWEREAAPAFLAFDPDRAFIEVADVGADGYGPLTVTLLDDEAPLPLIRYQTGDVARLLTAREVSDILTRHDIAAPAGLPDVFVALKGRDKDALPNGAHLSLYKDALYADESVAHHLTGAFRLTFSGTDATMHLQLRPGCREPGDLDRAILDAIPLALRPIRIAVWPYREFPFGMTVDYERKFTHFVAGEPDPG